MAGEYSDESKGLAQTWLDLLQGKQKVGEGARPYVPPPPPESPVEPPVQAQVGMVPHPMRKAAGYPQGPSLTPQGPQGDAAFAPVRTGTEVPRGVLTDDGRLVQVPPPRPRAVMVGPRPPQLPPGAHGGYYLPEDPNEVELRRLRGEITDEEAAALEARHRPLYHSVPGLQQRIAREQMGRQRGQLEAALPAMQAQQELAEQQAAAYQQMAEQQAREQQMAELRRADFARAYQQEVDKYNTAVQQVSAQKIDPDRWWESKSTGDKILTRVAAVFGALGSSLLGTPNHAAEQIQRDIDRDIAAQESSLANKRAGVQAKQGILGVMRQQYADDEMARTAARQFYYDRVKAQLQSMRHMVQGEEQTARIDAMIGELESKEREGELQLQLGAQSLADEEARRLMMLRMQQAAPQGPVARGAAATARYVSGLGLAPTAEAAKAVREAQAGTKHGVEAVDKLIKLSQKSGKGVDAVDRASAQAQVSLVTMGVNQAGGMGALDAGTQQLYSTIIADPTKIFSLDAANQARLSALKTHMQSQLRARVQATGFDPAHKVMGKKGPEYVYGPVSDQPVQTTEFSPIQ